MRPLTRRQFTKVAALAPFALGAMYNRARADLGRLGAYRLARRRALLVPLYRRRVSAKSGQ